MQSLINKIKSFGLPPSELAEKSGIVFEKVKAILDGIAEPNLVEVRKIAKVLKVAPGLLINDEQSIPALGTLFRKSFAGNDDPKITKLSYILNSCISIIDNYTPQTELFNRFPQVENTFDGARLLAQIFRELFYKSDFVSPILDLHTKVSTDLNCVILVYELGNNTDGASVIFNGIPFIIICPRFAPRMLFTLAHELGHILSHHREKSFAAIDSDNIPARRKNSIQEAFAHAFASELLMPQEGVGLSLKTIRRVLKIEGDFVGEVELLYLSRIYGVSFEVAALRCENLGIIPVGSAASLNEQLTKEFKSPEKRAQQLGLPERDKIVFPKISANLFNSTIEKISSGKISLENASERLTISAVDIINYNSKSEWI